MALFDEGTALAKVCNEKLNEAQFKIRQLADIENGETE